MISIFIIATYNLCIYIFYDCVLKKYLINDKKIWRLHTLFSFSFHSSIHVIRYIPPTIQCENRFSVSIALLLLRYVDGAASRSSINDRGRSSSISGASTLTPNSGRNGRCILFPSLLPALIKPETVRAYGSPGTLT